MHDSFIWNSFLSLTADPVRMIILQFNQIGKTDGFQFSSFITHFKLLTHTCGMSFYLLFKSLLKLPPMFVKCLMDFSETRKNKSISIVFNVKFQIKKQIIIIIKNIFNVVGGFLASALLAKTIRLKINSIKQRLSLISEISLHRTFLLLFYYQGLWAEGSLLDDKHMPVLLSSFWSSLKHMLLSKEGFKGHCLFILIPIIVAMQLRGDLMQRRKYAQMGESDIP